MKLPAKKNLIVLCYWMEERQRIYRSKLAGNPRPWTKDPILDRHKFCCVYREDDRGTVWLRQNWREPYAGHPNLWFAMCVARQINLPSTLEVIGFPEKWQPKRVLEKLRALATSGAQVYSGAYMLTAGGGNRGVDKPHITTNLVLDPLYKFASKSPPPWLEDSSCSLKQAASWFLDEHHYGFGPFMAYEVVSDLRHTRYLRNALDIYTWANPGPGARRGLNWLYDREWNAMPPREQLIDEMQLLLEWLGESLNRTLLPTLEMRDVEHSLCELWKYVRAKKQIELGQRVTLDLYKPAPRKLF